MYQKKSVPSIKNNEIWTNGGVESRQVAAVRFLFGVRNHCARLSRFWHYLTSLADVMEGLINIHYVLCSFLEFRFRYLFKYGALGFAQRAPSSYKGFTTVICNYVIWTRSCCVRHPRNITVNKIIRRSQAV